MASVTGSARSRVRAVTGWLARWATRPPTLHSGSALAWCQAAATSSRDRMAMTWSVAARNAGRRSRSGADRVVGSVVGSGIVALRWGRLVAGGLEAGPVGLLGSHLLALGAVRAEVAPRADRGGARREPR